MNVQPSENESEDEVPCYIGEEERRRTNGANRGQPIVLHRQHGDSGEQVVRLLGSVGGACTAEVVGDRGGDEDVADSKTAK